MATARDDRRRRHCTKPSQRRVSSSTCGNHLIVGPRLGPSYEAFASITAFCLHPYPPFSFLVIYFNMPLLSSSFASPIQPVHRKYDCEINLFSNEKIDIERPTWSEDCVTNWQSLRSVVFETCHQPLEGRWFLQGCILLFLSHPSSQLTGWLDHYQQMTIANGSMEIKSVNQTANLSVDRLRKSLQYLWRCSKDNPIIRQKVWPAKTVDLVLGKKNTQHGFLTV